MNLLCIYFSPLLSIILSGIVGVVLATCITILYDWRKQNRKSSNLLKGLISEISINLEYIEHNYKLAEWIKNQKPKASVFIPVRNKICLKVLASGEISLKDETRDLANKYLVTLDHLNQMIHSLSDHPPESNEYQKAIDRIKRYCRNEVDPDGAYYDFIIRRINDLKPALIQQYSFLKS
jgi:hypothetical protein